MRTLLLSALFAVGCASAGQPATHYAGEPFDLAARPSRITGQVCGMDLDVDVRHDGDAVALTGFLDGKFPVQLTARPLGRGVGISGALGSAAGQAAVELRVAADQLDGRVGFRRFDLRASGDSLVGTMQIPDAIEPPDVTLEGRAQLLALPLDAQAALLPALLSCNVQTQGKFGRSELLVRVGGAAGALPHQSSALYSHE
ncbi:MAG TPA: hypothetical protein VF945_01540 [Polyangia bacterium]